MLGLRKLSFLGTCLFLSTTICSTDPNAAFLRHIIKNAPLVFAGKESAIKLVHEAQKYGNADLLRALAGHANEETICEQLIRSIYNKNVVIKEVVVPETLIDEQGLLTEEGAEFLLVSASRDKKISESELPDFSSLSFDKSTIQKVGRVLQVFVITSENPDDDSFVFKSLQNRPWVGAESHRLIKASNFEPFQPIIYPNKVANMPQLIFPFSYLSYRHQDERHEMGLMHKAPGQSLTSVMKRLTDKPDNANVRRLVSQSYFDVGVAMASFYEAFKAPNSNYSEGLKSIIIDDLHVGNVFYDFVTRQVIIIDNERLANSIGRITDISRDLGYLLIQSVDMVKWVKTTPNFPFKDWFELSITNFVKGFLSIYPKEKKQDIYEILEHGLMTYKDSLTDTIWWEDPKTHQYLAPIFDSLRVWVNAETNICAK